MTSEYHECRIYGLIRSRKAWTEKFPLMVLLIRQIKGTQQNSRKTV